MEIKINLQYSMEIKNCNIDYLTGVVNNITPKVNSNIMSQVLQQFGEHYMKEKELPFSCDCGCSQATWKTKNAKKTKVHFGLMGLFLAQMQVKCANCKKRYFITRKLLELAPRAIFSSKAKKAIASIGSLCSYRVSQAIMGLCGGYNIAKTRIWECVQEVGSKLVFGVDLDEGIEFQADGTGIPINGIKKRGKELKVFIQKKIEGGVRIVNLSIGKYHSGWDELFRPILGDLKLMEKKHGDIILTTDGDVAILKGLSNLTIIIQRCLWHIPKQGLYVMWEDKIPRKSAHWLKILGKLFNIISYTYTGESKEVINEIIKEKYKLLDELIAFCAKHNYNKMVTYLTNAKPDMFSALKNKYMCKTTSLVERVMKTVNGRINIGKWGSKRSSKCCKS